MHLTAEEEEGFFDKDDPNPDEMYPFLAEIALKDWEDASAYGIPPGAAGKVNRQNLPSCQKRPPARPGWVLHSC
jgi:hypothetical protein